MTTVANPYQRSKATHRRRHAKAVAELVALERQIRFEGWTLELHRERERLIRRVTRLRSLIH